MKVATRVLLLSYPPTLSREPALRADFVCRLADFGPDPALRTMDFSAASIDEDGSCVIGFSWAMAIEIGAAAVLCGAWHLWHCFW
jgi:hypothetical protein